jgi:hypothetical protein
LLLRHFAESRQALEEREGEFLTAAFRLHSHDGAALCESLLLCFAAGKPLVVDPFNLRSQILTGRTREAFLVDAIAHHRFVVIVLPVELKADSRDPDRVASDVLTQARFTDATLAAIARYYAPIAHEPAAVFYAPREPKIGMP